MTYSVEYYQDLVTSEHTSSPKYMEWLGSMIEPVTVIQEVINDLIQNIDLDLAEGNQLDIVGLWVGVSRFLPVSIEGIYFTFDDIDLGFDNSVWKGPFDPLTGLSRMPDYIYRIMIKFKILANTWDGSIPTAYADTETVFEGESNMFIVDNQDMSMTVGIVGLVLGPLGIGVLEQGYFPFKPEGVRIKEFIINPEGNKLFAFDVQNDNFGGFDDGYFAQIIVPL